MTLKREGTERELTPCSQNGELKEKGFETDERARCAVTITEEGLHSTGEYHASL